MMVRSRRWLGLVSGLCLLTLLAGQLSAQGGPGYGRGRGFRGGRGGGRGPDVQFVKDRDDSHFLLQHHDQIRRKVTRIENGVQTVTESKNPQVAARIREHVKAMYSRVEEGRPIHVRDPLFAEVFRHADRIEMEFENTATGIRVTETSDDPYVARLIQAHADVVSLFVKNGFGEPHKNHAVPARDDAAAVSPPSDIPIPTATEQPTACCEVAASETVAKRVCAEKSKCATCPNATKCAAATKGCAAVQCVTCPMSDACPNAKQGCAVAASCKNAPSAKCATCPNATKCAAAAKGCAAGQCATCPMSDACPNAKQE